MSRLRARRRDLKASPSVSTWWTSLWTREQHVEKVLKGGRVVNVITREIYEADVAIEGRHIALVGDCSELIGPRTEVDRRRGQVSDTRASSTATCTSRARCSPARSSRGCRCQQVPPAWSATPTDRNVLGPPWA